MQWPKIVDVLPAALKQNESRCTLILSCPDRLRGQQTPFSSFTCPFNFLKSCSLLGKAPLDYIEIKNHEFFQTLDFEVIILHFNEEDCYK